MNYVIEVLMTKYPQLFGTYSPYDHLHLLNSYDYDYSFYDVANVPITCVCILVKLFEGTFYLGGIKRGSIPGLEQAHTAETWIGHRGIVVCMLGGKR